MGGRMDWERQNDQERADQSKGPGIEGDKKFARILDRAREANKALEAERLAHHREVMATLPKVLQAKLKYGPTEKDGFHKLKVEVAAALAKGPFAHKNGFYIETLIRDAGRMDWTITA